MYQLPPIPEWSNLHPLLTHFPLVLFLLLPILFILAGLCHGARNHTLWLASLVTLLAALGLLCMTFFSGVAFSNPAQKLPTMLPGSRSTAAWLDTLWALSVWQPCFLLSHWRSAEA